MSFPDRVKLSRRFDVDSMQRELERVVESSWVPHFVADNYEGEWSVLPLRSPADARHPIQMISSPPGCIEFADTPFLADLEYLRQVIASFRCPVTSVRLMRLAPGSRIREHRDHDLDEAEGVARVHIPITTNDDVRFTLNGEPVAFNPGDCWYLRLADLHSVANGGLTDRVHLVIDVVVNDWFRDRLREGLGQVAGEARAETAPVAESGSDALPLRSVESRPRREPPGAEVALIVRFLDVIGIDCKPGVGPNEPTVVPGVWIEAGLLRFDPAALDHPGDLLHEAGHIATAAPRQRSLLNGNLRADPAAEMAAIAWSYAASQHLGLDPHVVFHDDGYRGGSESLIVAFEADCPIGVPLLQWYGMTESWPEMREWLRTVDDPTTAT